MNTAKELFTRLAVTNGENALRFVRAAVACEQVAAKVDNAALSADYLRCADNFTLESKIAARTAFHAARLVVGE